MLDKEAQVLHNQLSQFMANKPEKPVSHAHGWFIGEILISVAISYFRMRCGACLSITLWERELDWGLGSYMGLAQ